MTVLLLLSLTAWTQDTEDTSDPCTTEQIEKRVEDATAKVDRLLAAMERLADEVADTDTDTPAEEAPPVEDAPAEDTETVDP